MTFERRPTRRRWHAAALALAATALVLVAGCATSPAATSGSGTTIMVVAAENFWGSIARQLGGSHVDLTSIITNPDTDPHDYEVTPADARTIASAQLVIVNGIGYDPWAPKLIAADPADNRTVLTVGDLVGIKEGGNPHRWYSPTDVHQVIEQLTADYQRIDPADAAYFAQRKQDFETHGLARYNQLIADIRNKYAGTPIGASESIVAPLAQGLGLRMLTPESFLDAISEGSEPSAGDKATIDNQLRTRQIKVYVFNSQNATPDVQAQVREARAAGIQVVSVTETLDPATATFQDWQVKQLQGIETALARTHGTT